MCALDISNRDTKYYEKRFEARYVMKCECNAFIDHIMFLAEIADISFNGLALLVHDYFGKEEIGDEIEIRILRENYPAVDMIAEIRNYVVADGVSRIGMQIKRGNKSVWDALVRQAQNGL